MVLEVTPEIAVDADDPCVPKFSDVAQSYGKLLSARAVLAAVKRDRAMLCEKIVQA